MEDRAGRKENYLRSTAAKGQQEAVRLNKQEVSWEDPVKDQDHQVRERIQTDMPTVNNVITLHDQKQKRIVDMPKVINTFKPHEKMNQPKSTCSLMSEKEDSIADCVTDKKGSLSALAKPFCPYMGNSMEEDQQNHLWGITNRSRGFSGNRYGQKLMQVKKINTKTIPLAGVAGVDVRQTTIFNIAIVDLNTLFRGNAINT